MGQIPNIIQIAQELTILLIRKKTRKERSSNSFEFTSFWQMHKIK